MTDARGADSVRLFPPAKLRENVHGARLRALRGGLAGRQGRILREKVQPFGVQKQKYPCLCAQKWCLTGVNALFLAIEAGSPLISRNRAMEAA